MNYFKIILLFFGIFFFFVLFFFKLVSNKRRETISVIVLYRIVTKMDFGGIGDWNCYRKVVKA